MFPGSVSLKRILARANRINARSSDIDICAGVAGRDVRDFFQSASTGFTEILNCNGKVAFNDYILFEGGAELRSNCIDTIYPIWNAGKDEGAMRVARCA